MSLSLAIAVMSCPQRIHVLGHLFMQFCDVLLGVRARGNVLCSAANSRNSAVGVALSFAAGRDPCRRAVRSHKLQIDLVRRAGIATRRYGGFHSRENLAR